MKISLFVLLGLLVGLLLFSTWTKEEVDPLWLETQAFVEQPSLQLVDAVDSLNAYMLRLHPMSATDPIALLSEPFFPTMTWEKFSVYLNRLTAHNRLLISGVNGSGMTTTAEALSKFIAGEDGHLLEIPFAPQFDLKNHERFIGKEESDGTWSDGELIRLIKRAELNPSKNYVLLLDDVDKGSLETFFGPYIWRHLGNPKYRVVLGNWQFALPENFYVIALSHFGVGNSQPLTNEHYTRFGGLSRITPSPEEFAQYLLAQQDQDSLLRNTAYLHRAVYRFAKAKAIVEETYGPDYTLGQWSDLRKMYRPSDEGAFNRTLLNHIAGLGPGKPVSEQVLSPLYYALDNDGLALGSSPWARQLAVLKDWGIASELIVAAIFTLLTAFGSFFFLKRRKQRLHKRIAEVQDVFYRLESGEFSFSEAQAKLDVIKSAVDQLVLDGDLNYTEANFFYNLLTDKLTQIRSRREVASRFSQMVEAFVEDGHLSKAEELKLRRYLERVKPNISPADFTRLSNEIEHNTALFQDG